MNGGAAQRGIRWLVMVTMGVIFAACGGAGSDARRGVAPAPSRGDRVEDGAKVAAREKEEALGNAEPAAVAPGDRAAYFDAVTRYRSRPYAVRDESPDPRDPDPESVRKVLWLDQLVGRTDPALAARIREWLFDRVEDFLQSYSYQTAKVVTSPPTSAWHQAEAAWTKWVTSQLATMTEGEASRISRGVSSGMPKGVNAFPGLDRFAVGLAIADLWIREGHPEVDRNRAAFEEVLCAVHNDYGKLGSYCGGGRGWWYREALSTDARAQQLAQVVLARKDPVLTATITLGVGTSPKTLTILRELEADATIWHDALLVLSRVDDYHWLQDWLLPELRRAWRSHPPWRGAILYALAQASGEYADEQHEEHGLVGFSHFTREFEGGVSRADFASFLEQSPRSLELARWIMPARAKGWSAVDLIVPRLDAYFALPPDTPKWSPRGPGFASVVGYLCYRDHDLAGLAKLRAYFEKRAPLHPGDPLNAMMDHYTAKECRSRG